MGAEQAFGAEQAVAFLFGIVIGVFIFLEVSLHQIKKRLEKLELKTGSQYAGPEYAKYCEEPCQNLTHSKTQ